MVAGERLVFYARRSLAYYGTIFSTPLMRDSSFHCSGSRRTRCSSFQTWYTLSSLSSLEQRVYSSPRVARTSCFAFAKSSIKIVVPWGGWRHTFSFSVLERARKSFFIKQKLSSLLPNYLRFKDESFLVVPL